jgi:hypothetical protein
MSNTIQIKRSSTASSVPTAGQLAQGELAVNLVDKKLYTKDNTNAVVEMGFYNQGNILGTISESSGVPTGAIIERGSNANGEFVKYADGTMICTNNNIGVLTTTSAQGNVFRSTNTLSWTFPVAFSATPSLGASSSSAARWVGSTADSTGGSFHLFFPTSNATNIDITGLVIGRWF